MQRSSLAGSLNCVFLLQKIFTLSGQLCKTAAYQDLKEYIQGNSDAAMEEVFGPLVVENQHPFYRSLFGIFLPRQANAVGLAGGQILSKAAGDSATKVDSWLFSGTGRIIVYGLIGAVTAFVTAEVYKMKGNTEENIQKIDDLIADSQARFQTDDAHSGGRKSTGGRGCESRPSTGDDDSEPPVELIVR